MTALTTTSLLWSQVNDPDNQSTLGEEDPGAAMDGMPRSVIDALMNRTQLRKALSRWENEGGSDGHDIHHGP